MLLSAIAPNPPQLDRVLLTGFLAMVVWLVCYKDQRTSTAFMIGMVVSSAVLTVFAFIQPGAWPLGFVQATLTVAALLQRAKRNTPLPGLWEAGGKQRGLYEESRMHRLFGSVGSEN
jgi:hypothetical protein